MRDFIGIVIGLIGAGIFYKLVFRKLIYFTFGFKKSMIVPICIYLIGFLLTIILFAPVITILGGTVLMLWMIIKFFIRGCILSIGIYIIYVIIRRIFS